MGKNLVSYLFDSQCRSHYRTHTHPFNGPLSGTTWVSRYQKGKTNLDFSEARDSEWQWHQLGHMQVCISLKTNNYTSTPPLSFFTGGCPSCHPTDCVKALKAKTESCKIKLLMFVPCVLYSRLVRFLWRTHSKIVFWVTSSLDYKYK